MLTSNAAALGVYTDLHGFDRLREEARKQSPEALTEVAQQFESLMVQMALKSMREAKLAEGAFDSDQSDFYMEMFDKQLSLTLSRGRGLGLADTLVRQLGGMTAAASDKAITQEEGSASVGHEAVRKPSFASPQAFIKDLLPVARHSAEKLNIDSRSLLAQAAVETDWGQRIIHHGDGRSSHNLFGAKAGSDWHGERVSVTKAEVSEGELVLSRQAFRSYPSYAAAFEDHAGLLQTNPAYRAALASGGDSLTFGQKLQDAGYTGDPDYGGRIAALLNSSSWQHGWMELKHAAAGSLT